MIDGKIKAAQGVLELGWKARPHPALRLVQGDVGSGKTIVAALAVLCCVEADHQAALMAPTELLAEQHLRNFGAWLQPLGVSLGWLSGRHKGKRRGTTLESLLFVVVDTRPETTEQPSHVPPTINRR